MSRHFLRGQSLSLCEDKFDDLSTRGGVLEDTF